MCEAGPLPWRLRCPFVADVAAAPPSWQFRPAIQQADLAPPGAASGTLIWAGCRPRRRIPASPLPGTWGPPPPAPAHRVVGTAGGQPVKVGRDAGGGRRQRQAEGAKGVTAAYARRRQNSHGSEPGVRPALFWVRQKHMYKAASYLPIPRSCKAPAATRSAAAPVPLHLAGWLSSAPTSSPPASTNLENQIPAAACANESLRPRHRFPSGCRQVQHCQGCLLGAAQPQGCTWSPAHSAAPFQLQGTRPLCGEALCRPC